MKLIKEYKNEEISETYLIILICNTIFMSIQLYCLDSLYKNKETLFNDYNSVSLFLILPVFIALTLHFLIFIITIIRYSIIKYRKNIINNVENIYLRNIEYAVILSCVTLIMNLTIIKSI